MTAFASPWLALLLFLTINIATASVFAIDKRRAIAGEWRIAESTLLMMALAGGSAGALWARRHFRHKTRKQPFGTVLEIIVGLQVVTVGLAAGWMAGAT